MFSRQLFFSSPFALIYPLLICHDLRHASTRSPQIADIRTLDKGDVVVQVDITDEAGVTPIQCEMVWAWTPKIRKVKEVKEFKEEVKEVKL